MRWTVAREVNVLALIKGRERYIFVYDDASRERLLDTFRDTASDPQSSFNWFDAAVLSQKAREQSALAATPARPRCRFRGPLAG
jgi:hypothetical protein